jgi:hypothetical protein
MLRADNFKLRAGKGRLQIRCVCWSQNLAAYTLANYDSSERICHFYICRIIYRRFHVALLLSEELHDARSNKCSPLF